jgi:hypothetical protein
MVKVRAKGEASAGKNCTSPVTYEADASPLLILIRAWIGGVGWWNWCVSSQRAVAGWAMDAPAWVSPCVLRRYPFVNSVAQLSGCRD